MVLIQSVDAIPLQTLVGFWLMQSLSDSIVYGFLFQNPVQSPMLMISDSTEFWSILLIFISYAAIWAGAASGRLISFNIFCGSYVAPVFRIV